MNEFVMAHPWMTLWIIAFGFLILDSVTKSICTCISNCVRYKMLFSNAVEEEKNGETKPDVREA